MHRERQGQTHTHTHTDRGRADTAREREGERERELADFVDWSLDNSILTIVANCIPRESEVGGFRSRLSFFFWIFSVSGCSCCTCQLSDRCGFFLLQVSDRFLFSFPLLDFEFFFFSSSSSSSSSSYVKELCNLPNSSNHMSIIML